MNKQRRNEIDEEMSLKSMEFHENASHGDGNFGVLYISCDVEKRDFWVSLEANRETFQSMMLSLLNQNEAVAEDILVAVDAYRKENEPEQAEMEDWISIDELREGHNKKDSPLEVIRELIRLICAMAAFIVLTNGNTNTIATGQKLIPSKTTRKHLLN
jgi:hypothetical protein